MLVSKLALHTSSTAAFGPRAMSRPIVRRSFADAPSTGGRVKIEAPNWDAYRRDRYSDAKTRKAFSYLVSGTAAAGESNFHIFLVSFT